MNQEQLAETFHYYYELLAPKHGYKTREESAVPWEKVPEKNKNLMVAVAGEIMNVMWLKRKEILYVLL